MQHPAWNGLLAWLETGHGMDISQSLHVDARSTPLGYGMCALREIPPSTPLFTIPASALLNSLTLSRHYPKAEPKLSNVQLTSLHLLLHRPSAPGTSLDPLYGPYISVLPSSFNTHPLVWYWKRGDPSSPGSCLLDHLPPYVGRDLERVAKTFQGDWERVRSYVQSNGQVLSTATNPNTRHLLAADWDAVIDDYLWAWLSVNTRCVYYRIKESKSDPDNFTLCPILDFANHSSVEASLVPQVFSGDIWDMTPLKKSPGDLTLLSPSEITLPGRELFLRYGYHSNQFLFTEYGFAGPIDGQSDVDITPVVENLFRERGIIGEWMQERLLEENYWGAWTLHSTPAPAHPSFRLITALRLCLTMNGEVIRDDKPELLDAWCGTINGNRDSISDENEALWKMCLLQICGEMVKVATAQISSLNAISAQGGACVVALWEEERFVAKAVIESLREGAVF